MTMVVDAPVRELETVTEAETPDEIVVDVLQWHIDTGRRVSSDGCAVALALRGMGYSNEGLNVGHSCLTLSDGRKYQTPPVCAHWIRCFDTQEHVEPARFIFRNRIA